MNLCTRCHELRPYTEATGLCFPCRCVGADTAFVPAPADRLPTCATSCESDACARVYTAAEFARLPVVAHVLDGAYLVEQRRCESCGAPSVIDFQAVFCGGATESGEPCRAWMAFDDCGPAGEAARCADCRRGEREAAGEFELDGDYAGERGAWS